jgi:hypothetical protein
MRVLLAEERLSAILALCTENVSTAHGPSCLRRGGAL